MKVLGNNLCKSNKKDIKEFINTFIEKYEYPNIGYTLDTEAFLNIETWTSFQEEEERLSVFNNLLWFPVRDFYCEYCGETTSICNANFQNGFSFDPDDEDRIRILCENCSEN